MQLDMATPTSATSLKHSEQSIQHDIPSDASTHSKGPLDANGTAQKASTIAPFELEGTNVDDIEYPTGLKFAFVLMATGLSLILVGLVRSLHMPNPLATNIHLSRSGC